MPKEHDLRKLQQEPGLHTEELKERQEAFLKAGFSDEWVERLKETRPTLYTPDILELKLSGLKDRGFSNPTKLIESLPAILGLAFDNIDRRLTLLRRLASLYNLSFSPVSLMERNFMLFSSKMDKLLVLCRIMRAYNVKPVELNETLVRRLTSANLEDVLVAFRETPPDSYSIQDLLRAIPQVKAKKLSKEYKRRLIRDELTDFKNIQRRYLQGYPEE